MHYFDTPLYIFMPIIFFIYGMSFFMLGATVAIERLAIITGANKFRGFVSSPLGFLAFFGITHGLFEFISMYSILDGELILPLKLVRLVLLSLSFCFLCKFGASYGDKAGRQGINGEGKTPSWFSLANVTCGIWVVLSLVSFARLGLTDRWFTISEIFSRYFIGVPGAVMASVAFWSFDRGQMPGSKKYRIAASMSFAVYAIVGALVVPRADFFPASWLNYETFHRVTHVPIAALRTLCAVVATFSLLQLFRLSKDFSGIRFKAIMHVVIAVAVPTICIVLLVCYLVGDALMGLSYREHEMLASVTADRVYSILDDAEESVKYYMMYSRINPAVSKKDIFLALVRGNAAIKGVAFYDENGEILSIIKDAASSVSYTGVADNNRINKFLEGFTPDLPVDNFHAGGNDNGDIIMTVPLGKKRLEVLFDPFMVYKAGNSIGLGKGWHFLLLDDKGKIILPKERPLLKEEQVLAHLASSPGIYGRKTIENGIYYNVIEAKMRHTDWSVILEIPRNEVVAPIFSVFKALLLGVLVVVLSAVVVAVLFVGKVTKPINLIAMRVKSIGREELTPALNISTGDELQVLSEEVEKMALLLAEKKKMEKQIIQTEKLASLGRIIAGVAHEINNPLGIILGYSQLLQRECEPQSRFCDDLKKVERHTLACKKIVEDLLKFSRTNKQMNVEMDIPTSIRETLALVEKHFSKEHVAVSLEADPGTPLIMGDPDKLRQLFLNLALNALDAMKDGGSLTVAVRSLEPEEGKGVEITFKDTGRGIAQEDMGKIFDPFFTTKDVGKGTGLGLSVSYGIVKDHGGRIWAESELGKGAIFHVMFPALKNNEQ